MPRDASSRSKISSPAPDAALSYDEVIHSRGIDVPFVPEIITPKIERPMRNSRYEGGECQHLDDILQSDDRVLDLGAGVGLVSSIAARAVPQGRVTAVEANPDLIPLIRETYRLNEIDNVNLMHAIAGPPGSGGVAPFYLRPDFWASSMEPDSRPYVRTADVPIVDIRSLLQDAQPTVICCDIEGGELGLFDSVDLSGVNHIVMELHAKVYGTEGSNAVIRALSAQGLHPVEQAKASSVQVFTRTAKPARTTRPVPREPVAWPPENPRILTATCMKNEGPFVLEWLAWHRAMGLTDIYVFTNDCTDGTDALLDRLEEMGELHHLPNPAAALQTSYLQPTALRYIQDFRAFREADFFLSFDVDEFVNVKSGKGTFSDLFASVEPFDALSVSELNHGANGKEAFRAGWITGQFPRHETEAPGKWRARRGVKTIVRLTDAVTRVRNHIPDLRNDLLDRVWLDGSGKPVTDLMDDPSQNGLDCRGRYDLVSLDHFPLRSIESYLAKMDRGDVVIEGKQVGQRYWRSRNRNEELTSDLAPGIARARAYFDSHFAGDRRLMELHDACCTAHAARIADLLDDPHYRERRDWILSEAWD